MLPVRVCTIIIVVDIIDDSSNLVDCQKRISRSFASVKRNTERRWLTTPPRCRTAIAERRCLVARLAFADTRRTLLPRIATLRQTV